MSTLAAVIPEPEGGIELRELPDPQPKPGGAVMRVEYTEVCGTDVHLYHGRLAGTPYPLIPGHFNVGVIESVGEGAADAFGRPLSVGQRVTFLDVHRTCGRCWYCLVAKAPTRCPNRRVYGITYGLRDGLLGGWAERLELLPGTLVLPLPEDLDPLLLMAGGCAITTALHAVDLAEIRLGDTVVVLGAGPVGLMACALAALSGAERVISVEPAEVRAEAAIGFGAETTLSGAQEARELLQQTTPAGGADVVIEATGNPKAVVEAMDLARDAGRVVVVGQYTDAGDVAINPHWHINRKHLRVQGCWGIDFSHLYRAVRLLAGRRDEFPWRTVVSKVYSLGEAARALEDVEARRVVKAVIAPGQRPERKEKGWL